MTKIGVFLTPIKPKLGQDVCFVCLEPAKQPKHIGSSRCKGEEDLKLKLAKYVQLHVESGTICRNCLRQLETIIKNINKFRSKIVDSGYKRCKEADFNSAKVRRQLIEEDKSQQVINTWCFINQLFIYHSLLNSEKIHKENVVVDIYRELST